MFTNKFQQGIKRCIFSKHTLISVLSCFMLFICGALSASSNVKAKTGNVTTTYVDEAKQVNTTKRNAKTRSKAKQDPTRPPSMIVQQLLPQVDVEPEFQLTAIFTRNQQQYAVVNGDIVKAGDSVANMFVKEITSTNLVMQDPLESSNGVVLELSDTSNVKKQVQE